MKIGELATRSGLAPSRIRFYEASGLLSAQRQANGYRRYPEQALHTLGIISGAQQAGLAWKRFAACCRKPTQPVQITGNYSPACSARSARSRPRSSA